MKAQLGGTDAALQAALDEGDVYTTEDKGLTFYCYREIIAGSSKGTTSGHMMSRNAALTHEQFKLMGEKMGALGWDLQMSAKQIVDAGEKVPDNVYEKVDESIKGVDKATAKSNLCWPLVSGGARWWWVKKKWVGWFWVDGGRV
jgi:hypothetical protein